MTVSGRANMRICSSSRMEAKCAENATTRWEATVVVLAVPFAACVNQRMKARKVVDPRGDIIGRPNSPQCEKGPADGS